MQAIQAVSSIKFTSLLLLAAALTQGVLGYPGGAPYCSARPGHGYQAGDAEVLVERCGGSFLLNITTTHKGIVVRASEAGSWLVGEGHRLLNDCVTHDNRRQKYGGILLFTPRDPQYTEPLFSGYLVTSYSQYQVLDQVWKPEEQLSTQECSGNDQLS